MQNFINSGTNIELSLCTKSAFVNDRLNKNIIDWTVHFKEAIGTL